MKINYRILEEKYPNGEIRFIPEHSFDGGRFEKIKDYEKRADVVDWFICETYDEALKAINDIKEAIFLRTPIKTIHKVN